MEFPRKWGIYLRNRVCWIWREPFRLGCKWKTALRESTLHGDQVYKLCDYKGEKHFVHLDCGIYGLDLKKNAKPKQVEFIFFIIIQFGTVRVWHLPNEYNASYFIMNLIWTAILIWTRALLLKCNKHFVVLKTTTILKEMRIAQLSF